MIIVMVVKMTKVMLSVVRLVSSLQNMVPKMVPSAHTTQHNKIYRTTPLYMYIYIRTPILHFRAFDHCTNILNQCTLLALKFY